MAFVHAGDRTNQFPHISHHYFSLFSLMGSLVALHRFCTKISSKNVAEQRLCNSLQNNRCKVHICNC